MESEAFLQSVNESVRLHQSQARLGCLQSRLLVDLDGEVSFVFFIPPDHHRTTLDSNWLERLGKIFRDVF